MILPSFNQKIFYALIDFKFRSRNTPQSQRGRRDVSRRHWLAPPIFPIVKRVTIGSEMGEGAGVPIEPPEQTKLSDATLELEGVAMAGVPGAGGYDAVIIRNLRNSNKAMGIMETRKSEMPINLFTHRNIRNSNLFYSAAGGYDAILNQSQSAIFSKTLHPIFNGYF